MDKIKIELTLKNFIIMNILGVKSGGNLDDEDEVLGEKYINQLKN